MATSVGLIRIAGRSDYSTRPVKYNTRVNTQTGGYNGCTIGNARYYDISPIDRVGEEVPNGQILHTTSSASSSTVVVQHFTGYRYSYKFSSDGTGKVDLSSYSYLQIDGSTKTVNVTFTPNSGRTFSGWYLNDTKVSSSKTLQIAAGSSAEETYTAKTHATNITVTVSSSGPAGSVYVSKSSTATSGTKSISITYSTGVAYCFAKTTSAGRFLRWSDGSVSQTRTITGRTANLSLTAIFSDKYVGVNTSGADGSAYVGQSGTDAKRYFAAGDTVVVRAYPNNSSVGFVGWYDGNMLISESATYTFSFEGESISLTARFLERQRTYRIVLNDVNYGMAAIHPGGYNPGVSRSVGQSYTASFGERIGFDSVIRNGMYNGVYRRGRFVGWFTDSSYTQLKTDAKNFDEIVPSVYSDVTYYAKFVQADVVTITANVSDGESAVTDRGEVSIITDAVAPGQGYYSGAITFEIVPHVGFHVEGWLVNGADKERSDNSVTFDIDANSTVTAVVTENAYKITCVIDEASLGCGECKLQTSEDSGETWDDAESDEITHGTLCRALISTAQGGAGVFRRLSADGDDVSVIEVAADSWAYQFNATSKMSFVAFFGNTLQVAAKHVTEGVYDDEEYGKATISTSESEVGTEQSLDFTYGDTLYVHATNSTDEEHPAYFVGWHSVTGGSPSESRILNMGAVAAVTPTTSSPLTYWAEFKNEREVCAISLTNSGTTYGRLSLVVLDGGEAEEISQEEYDDILDEHFPSGLLGAANDTADKYYSMPLGTRILVSCETNESLNVRFDTWKLKTHVGRHSYDNPLGTPIGNGPEAEHIVAGDEVFMATYKTQLPAKVVLRYGDESTPNDGAIRLSPIGSNPVQQDSFVSGDFTPDTDVTALATPRNGYAFVGWYSDSTCEDLVSGLASYTFNKASSPEMLYAKFVQDDNAIFVWEGEDSDKMMTWRSRRVQLPQPMNFSSAAVCADDYPLQLKVAYASAPDPAASGWKEGGITINNQDPRRLPILRPERYVEVEVRSDKPVLRVAVASSMAGLLG